MLHFLVESNREAQHFLHWKTECVCISTLATSGLWGFSALTAGSESETVSMVETKRTTELKTSLTALTFRQRGEPVPPQVQVPQALQLTEFCRQTLQLVTADVLEDKAQRGSAGASSSSTAAETSAAFVVPAVVAASERTRWTAGTSACCC